MKTLTLIAALAMLTAPTFAEDKPVFSKNDSMFSLLTRQTGQSVQLVLNSGEKFGGKVADIGGGFVYLTALTGQEFYDAVIKLDDISAVVVRKEKK